MPKEREPKVQWRFAQSQGDLVERDIAEQIRTALEGLFSAVAMLKDAYPGKPFTLDGRLVGDIGEVVASLAYAITLNEGLTRHHDAVSDDGLNVQIKATFGTTLTFPVHHVPDYYLGIKLNRDGTFEGGIQRTGGFDRRPTGSPQSRQVAAARQPHVDVETDQPGSA